MERHLTKVDEIVVRVVDAFLSLIDVGTIKMDAALRPSYSNTK